MKQPGHPTKRAQSAKRGFLHSLIVLWPVSRKDQMLVAEILAQGIAGGMEIGTTLAVAAEVHPSRRVRDALKTMRGHVMSGFPLEKSLSATGLRVDAALPAALRVGQARGCLAQELSQFARRLHADPVAAVTRAVGRSREATRFAAALARLTREHPLNLPVIREAGEIAAEGNGRFLEALRDIENRMQGYGRSLTDSLSRHPRYFDRLYIALLQAAETRRQTRQCFEMLGRR